MGATRNKYHEKTSNRYPADAAAVDHSDRGTSRHCNAVLMPLVDIDWLTVLPASITVGR